MHACMAGCMDGSLLVHSSFDTPTPQKKKEAKDKEREKAVFRRLAQWEPRPNEGKWVDMLGALDRARQRSAAVGAWG